MKNLKFLYVENVCFQSISGIILMLILLLQGCEKSEFHPRTPGKAPSNEAQLSVDSQFVNPRNYIGTHYTYALDHLANKVNFPDFTGSQVFAFQQSYYADSLEGQLLNNYTEAQQHFEDLIGDTASYRAEFANLEVDSFFEQFNNHTGLSGISQDYIQKLKTEYTSYSSEAAFIDSLASHAEAVLNEELAQDEQALLLSMYALARDAMVYWQNAREEAGHSWHTVLHQNLTNQEAKSLAVNLSVASALGFGLGFEDVLSDEHILKDGLHTGSVQAAFVPGPMLIDPEET